MGFDTETTARTEPSIEEKASSKRLALQWVFPEASSPQPLRGATVTLGRAEDSVIRLRGQLVSRRHAEIYRQGRLWVLRDCGSTNGTFLNGAPVGHEPLGVGSVVRIGPNVGVTVWVAAGPSSGGLVETSPGFWIGDCMREALAPALRAAQSKIPIAISGETGTGKEQVARAVHHHSGRTGAFVGVNCAAISERIAEAELFGHVKGAFTGATSSSSGYLRASSGGTLFLDEVTELPLPLQTKLLRALQEQEVTPVGSQQAVPVDLRIVSAAQRSLSEHVEAATFREDLMMRLDGLSLVVPPLRERAAEIPSLFSLFVKRGAGSGPPPTVDPKLIEALCVARWPGNVRQLELVAQRLMALHEPGKRLMRRDLPPDWGTPKDNSRLSTPADGDRVAHDVERLVQAMAQCSGNIAEAARCARVSRQRAYRLLQEHAPEVLAAR